MSLIPPGTILRTELSVDSTSSSELSVKSSSEPEEEKDQSVIDTVIQ